MTLSLVFATLTANSVWADPASCEAKLDACRSAVNEQEREIELRKLGIQMRDEERVRLYTENEKLRSAETSWARNPFIWAALGVIIGAYAGARAVR